MHQFFVYKFTKKHIKYTIHPDIWSMKQQSSKACNPCHATSSSLHYFLLFLVVFFPINRWVEREYAYYTKNIYTWYPHSLTHPPSSSTAKTYPFITWRLSLFLNSKKATKLALFFKSSSRWVCERLFSFLSLLNFFFAFWINDVRCTYIHRNKFHYRMLLLFIATIYF